MKYVYGVKARYENFDETWEDVLFMSLDYELCKRVADKLQKRYDEAYKWFELNGKELSREAMDDYLYENFKLFYCDMNCYIEYEVFSSEVISEEQELIELNLI